MMKGLLIAICVHFVPILPAFSQVAAPQPSVPDQFLISRHTFVDFGSPTDFYDVFSIRSTDGGTSIERVTLTPAGDECFQPATVGVASATLDESVAQLLGKTNPCTIPERELRRERKRCKNCVVFSGADIAMHVQCTGKERRIRMDILDRDMFDPNPNTPEYTSWTMKLLTRLDGALGDTVMDRPAFTLTQPPNAPASYSASSVLVDDLTLGKYDDLFEKADHKLSDLVRDSRKPRPTPIVELSSVNRVGPTFYELPKYPPIARMARIEGDVVFSLDVTPSGDASNISFTAAHPMLQKSVESAVSNWHFAREAAGKKIHAVIHFKTNCPPPGQ